MQKASHAKTKPDQSPVQSIAAACGRLRAAPVSEVESLIVELLADLDTLRTKECHGQEEAMMKVGRPGVEVGSKGGAELADGWRCSDLNHRIGSTYRSCRGLAKCTAAAAARLLLLQPS
eukprot:196142-Chlamydomonas_euryale.AAC.2